MINVTNVTDFTPTIEYTKITRSKQNSRISNNNDYRRDLLWQTIIHSRLTIW